MVNECMDHRGPDGRTDWTHRVIEDRTEGRTGHTGSPRTGRTGHTGSPRTLMEGLSSSRVSNTMITAEMSLPSVPLKGTAQFNVPLHSNIKGYLSSPDAG